MVTHRYGLDAVDAAFSMAESGAAMKVAITDD
jgi:Zn-dependent alcohol dehydrogenase